MGSLRIKNQNTIRRWKSWAKKKKIELKKAHPKKSAYAKFKQIFDGL